MSEGSGIAAMSQLSLGALFAGRRGAVTLPPKRPVGRPPKRGPEADEAVEREEKSARVVVRASDVRNAELPHPPPWRRGMDDEGSLRELREVLELTGDSSEVFEGIPGTRPARDETFGLQAKVRFCDWFRKREAKAGFEKLLGLCVRHMGRPRAVLLRALMEEKELRAALAVRGVTATGLRNSDSKKPSWMRVAGRKSKGTALRKAAAGRQAHMRFLYPLVRECFLETREKGLLSFPQDLRLMRRWSVRRRALGSWCEHPM